MSLQIILATGNQGKADEVAEIVDDPDIRVCTMKDAGILSDPEEDGTTFEENALIKARACAALLPKDPGGRAAFLGSHGLDPDIPAVVVSDDSGLVIDALDGAPGILSARWLGRDTSYSYKMQHILELLRNVPDEKRSARFVAAIAAVLPDDTEFTVRGVMEGRIAHAIAGSHGFGYDPIFYLPRYGCTSAEIPPEEKNRISHRGQGMRAMITALRERYGTV
ncbi:MAG: non-canonical purine NTP pyrophosphatase [Lachnospiraceae bacterium]|jgi:XTP/dITP diphosphohydrolase|nr:non-canonical purine NTP pyrophosphatase [Lachnospiraceae bacterium]